LKLQVLNVYRTYYPDPPGGLQEAIRQICLSTNTEGIDNTIYTLSPKPHPKVLFRPEARVIRQRSWIAPASCDIGGIPALATFKSESDRADLLHYYFPWPFADVLHTAVKPRKPAMMTYISDVVRQRWLGKAYEPLMWRMLREMRLVVANCPAYAKTSPILSHPDVASKVRIIPLGIDETSYPMTGDEAILGRLNLSRLEPYFLFIGVLRYYKGLSFLIEAARQVNARIVVAGSGPEQHKLMALAKEKRISNVVFAGQITNEQKVALLKNCRALVLPSHLRSEAYGIVLVEASMFGKPMISCEIGTGTSFVNLHEITGLVVPSSSPEALAKAMRALLDNNAMTINMGKEARKRYEQNFSGPALGKAYSDLYREIVS